MIVPQRVFLTNGVGSHADRIHAFELALRNAGIEQVNLVPVSSILPPGCRIVDREEGRAALVPGAITFCVMARAETEDEGHPIASAICIAAPRDPLSHGYIGEHVGLGEVADEAEDRARELAISMLSSSQDEGGLAFTSISCTARGKENKWTVAVAIAVFLEDVP